MDAGKRRFRSMARVLLPLLLALAVIAPAMNNRASAAASLHYLYGSGSATGGKTVSFRVELTEPAPSGGAVVTLNSNNAAIPLPATVTVSAGQTERSFGVASVPVTADTNVTVSATYLGVTKSRVVTILEPYLSSMRVQTRMRAGGTGEVVVRLSGRAYAGGVTVNLTSSNPAVIASPGNVVVPAGVANFQVVVNPTFQIQDVPVTFTASYDGNTLTGDTIVRYYPTDDDLTATAIAGITQTADADASATEAANQTATANANASATEAANQASTAAANETATAMSNEATQTSIANDITQTAIAADNAATQTQVAAEAQATQTAQSVEATNTAAANETSTAIANETSTAAANETATQIANETATEAANQTATTAANETATQAANETATAAVNETATQVSIDETVAAQTTQTAIAGATETAIANTVATGVAGTQTAQANATQTTIAEQTAAAQTTETAIAAETETAAAQQTADAQITETAIADATGTAAANATGTAVANATGTAVAATATASAVPLTWSVTRTDNDPVISDGETTGFSVCRSGTQQGDVTVYLRSSNTLYGRVTGPGNGQDTALTFTGSTLCLSATMYSQFSGDESGNARLVVYSSTGGSGFLAQSPLVFFLN